LNGDGERLRFSPDPPCLRFAAARYSAGIHADKIKLAGMQVPAGLDPGTKPPSKLRLRSIRIWIDRHLDLRGPVGGKRCLAHHSGGWHRSPREVPVHWLVWERPIWSGQLCERCFVAGS
jgi:hypothetical protein